MRAAKDNTKTNAVKRLFKIYWTRNFHQGMSLISKVSFSANNIKTNKFVFRYIKDKEKNLSS